MNSAPSDTKKHYSLFYVQLPYSCQLLDIKDLSRRFLSTQFSIGIQCMDCFYLEIMKKFEYKMVHQDREKLYTNVDIIFKHDIPFANRLGDEGWELIQVEQLGDSTYFYFKREKQ